MALVVVVSACFAASAKETSLKEAYKDDFLIGVALGGNLPDDYTVAELAVIKSQFNAVTPENCMKPEWSHLEEDRWDFTQADALMDFAEANHMQIFGHTLVWHNQNPKWLFVDGEKEATREKMLQRMKSHIQTLVGRYKGRIRGWDVVNEAIAEGGTKDLRPTPGLKTVGDDYIVKAFQFAHEADPKAELQYNDYNIESGTKRERTVRLIQSLKEAGVPLAAVGIQGHWILDKVPFEDIDSAIDEFHKLGVKVMFTEVDLDVIPRKAGADLGQLEEGDRSAKQSGPDQLDERLKRQAEQYAKLFAIFHKHKDAISRVTFWGLNDARSWLNYWPRQRVDHPLLFDRQSQPKPALKAVIDVVAESKSN